MKKVFSIIIVSVFALEAIAQSGPSAGIVNDPMLPVYLTGGAVVLLLILVAAVTFYVIRVLNVLTQEALVRKATHGERVHIASRSWWERYWEKINASVPVEQEKAIELDHSYDGIRELDNHLPPWWKALFYGSIVFAVVYLVIYHVTDTLPLAEDEYRHELAMAEDQVRKYRASQPQATIDEKTLEYTADPEAIENGSKIFVSNACGGCHRNDGGGNTIGPNLADEYWLHGGDVRSVFATIRDGVVEKGMPAWGKSMSAKDVRDVTFFVMSLQGTNPPDAKAPQGDIFRHANTTTDSLGTQAGL